MHPKCKGEHGDKYLWRHVRCFEAELVHDPASLDPIRSPVPVEHQRLPHPDNLAARRVVHRPVLPRCFPVPCHRRPVGPEAGGVLAIAEAEEVPLIPIQLRHIYRTREDCPLETLSTAHSMDQIIPNQYKLVKIC